MKAKKRVNWHDCPDWLFPFAYNIRKRAIQRKARGLPPEQVPTWKELDQRLCNQLSKPSPWL